MKRFTTIGRKILLASIMLPLALAAQTQMPQPPEIAARNYLLLDVSANQVLAQKDIDAPIEQASLTKLMTAYIVFDALRARKIALEQTFPVSERAWKMPGSRMFIDPKMQVPVDDLLKGMIVQSGNDATVALAEGVGGSVEYFVSMMNNQARVLGMSNTQYKNPEGLTEPGHLTTARDLGTLAISLMHEFPEYMHYYKTKQYRYEGTPKTNSNNRNILLFRDPTVDGLKTGYTAAAGYCLVATSQRDIPSVGKRRLLSIVLGTTSENVRANESQKLLNWGYIAFDAFKLFDAKKPIEHIKIWKGAANTVALGSFDPIIVAVPANSAQNLETSIERSDPLMAPVSANQKIGTLKVTFNDLVVKEVPLVALESVAESGIWGRSWDAIKLWLH